MIDTYGMVQVFNNMSMGWILQDLLRANINLRGLFGDYARNIDPYPNTNSIIVHLNLAFKLSKFKILRIKGINNIFLLICICFLIPYFKLILE